MSQFEEPTSSRETSNSLHAAELPENVAKGREKERNNKKQETKISAAGEIKIYQNFEPGFERIGNLGLRCPRCRYQSENIRPRVGFSGRPVKVTTAEKRARYVLWGVLGIAFFLAFGIIMFLVSQKILDSRQISILQQNKSSLTQEIAQLQKQFKHQLPSNTAEIIRHRDNLYDIYTVNIENSDIRFFWQNSDGQRVKSLGNLRDWLAKNKQTLVFATNAGMYTPERAPQGLYIENGEMLVPVDTANGSGNFYLKPNGIFLLTTDNKANVVETSAYSEINVETVKYATQSGPLLLNNGNMHPAFQKGSSNKYIRSGVGVKNDLTTVVFAISINPVNFYDFALLFQEQFKCDNALYLDGQVSRMYLPALNRYDSDGDFGAMIAVLE